MMVNTNTPFKQHADVNYLVVGLGLTGFSTARYLMSKDYCCRVQDTRDIPPYFHALRTEFPLVDIIRQPLNSELIDWADVLVVSPGLSIAQPEIIHAIDLGKSVIGDIELFAQVVNKPVVAITGSNGKSTVTTLLGEMIAADNKSVAVGGNLGIPALDLLPKMVDYFVLELSSYQLETTKSLQLVSATVLNFSEDHLDRYNSYADYIQAKLHIYEKAKTCVSNEDDETTRHDSNDILFGLTGTSKAEFGLVVNDSGTWLAHKNEPWINVKQLKVCGRHNWANCLAAMALACTLDISRQAIIKAMMEFKGIPHRSEWIAEIEGVEWINDSKATNVGAALASIESQDRPIILIAGGQSKNADMGVLYEPIKQRVKLVLLMGVDADRIEHAWVGAAPIERVDHMANAVVRAKQEAVSGDCVLLAPACASFDMYSKFEARGDDFANQVRQLHHV
jgi:UDP-N-acetylmuramoylalanine--D-glutamate ligase|tara:strand:+ start:8401 stop:9750 length:1350 start_codon:yes stop_codon:yes gene_type:complete